MSIDNFTLKEGATYAPTGGTDITFSASGEQVASGVVSANFAETDFFSREKARATARQPALGSDGEYSKAKNSLQIIRPYTLASGKVVYNLIRIELEVHPESGDTEAANLMGLGCGALCDAELDSFFKHGALS